MVQLEWNGKVGFQVTPPSGARFNLDLPTSLGGDGAGPTPTEALLAAIAGCTAFDVVSILEKKRQTVTNYRIEIDGQKAPEGEYPRPFLKIQVKHILSGESLDPEAVARAIELSDTKYCSVMATLRQMPEITSTWEIEERRPFDSAQAKAERGERDKPLASSS